jgi:hypothetical protein
MLRNQVCCSKNCANKIRRHPTLPADVRFWSKVRKSVPEECWEWQGRFDKGGYGVFTLRHGKSVKAHRFAYEIRYGPMEPDKFACHKCHNRRCCNYDHIYQGTPKDNSRDMVESGRSVSGQKWHETHLRNGMQGDNHWTKLHPERLKPKKGEGNPQSKLSQAKVNEIRQKYSNGNISQARLAKEYGISQSHIQRVISGVRWSN